MEQIANKMVLGKKGVALVIGHYTFFLMWSLAPRSAYMRPSAQPPINTSRNFPPSISAICIVTL